jgi:hypothetical protein
MAIPHATTPLTGARADVRELDLVTLGVPVRADGEHCIPAGSTGTVVGIWGEGRAYEVEFTEPVPALATVEPHQISGHMPYDT